MPSNVILVMLKLITGWVTLIMLNTMTRKHSKHMSLLGNMIREAHGLGMGSEMFIYAGKITRVPSTPSNKSQRLTLIMHGVHGHGTNKGNYSRDLIVHQRHLMLTREQLLQAKRKKILLFFTMIKGSSMKN